MGARLVVASDASHVFHGTTAQREDWGGPAEPVGGDHRVPQALALLQLDRDGDGRRPGRARCTVRHRWAGQLR